MVMAMPHAKAAPATYMPIHGIRSSNLDSFREPSALQPPLAILVLDCVACKESLEATVKLNYGTYEELEIFAQAVERWSISCLDMLPEYMKLIYQELVNLHVDMEESLEKEGKSYQINYVKDMVNCIFFNFEFHDLDKYCLNSDTINTGKELVRNYLVEARWLKEGDMPTLEEYMSMSTVTGT
nr:(E)-beta-farnesene synthase-like [Tanacetum cinerariifolium]